MMWIVQANVFKWQDEFEELNNVKDPPGLDVGNALQDPLKGGTGPTAGHGLDIARFGRQRIMGQEFIELM